MFGLDDKIAALSTGEVFLIVIAVAVLLGLRHATDPDHLTAVSTLVASQDDHGPKRAGALGFSWGLGHATTLFVFGLPIVLFNRYLPDRVQQGAEVAIGFLIIGLAVRLLVRWRRGYFHSHSHPHPEDEHRHVHMHERPRDAHVSERDHEHRHAAGLGRSPLQAYGIGLLHGMGGSAGVGVLLLASIPDHVEGVAALVVFAFFTAVSMAIASSSFGYALSRGPVLRRFVAVAPVLGVVSLAFGVWYALGALNTVPYYF
jgi:ABC-type nickel/cobalt efflux system permease component RcnA